MGREREDLGMQEPKDGPALAWTPGHRALRIEEPLSLAVLGWRQAYSLVRSSFSL